MFGQVELGSANFDAKKFCVLFILIEKIYLMQKSYGVKLFVVSNCPVSNCQFDNFLANTFILPSLK